MILFKTERLIIKTLETEDQNLFFELFSDPKIIRLIPQLKIPENQLLERFSRNLNVTGSDLITQKCDFGIFEIGNPEIIGLCSFLINDENEKEIGYRFRVAFWGKGYGTETTEAMIDYYFNVMHVDKVTADVDIVNVGSVKILSKFMTPLSEFFNERENCTDRRYQITRDQWLKNGIAQYGNI